MKCVVQTTVELLDNVAAISTVIVIAKKSTIVQSMLFTVIFCSYVRIWEVDIVMRDLIGAAQMNINLLVNEKAKK